MTVKSGKSGTVSWDAGSVDDVTNITFVDGANVKEYASSSTSGQVSRFAGHGDATGSFTIKADAVSFSKGDTGALIVKSDGAVTLYPTAAFPTARAIILDLSYTVPVEEGEAIEVVVTWGQQKPA